MTADVVADLTRRLAVLGGTSAAAGGLLAGAGRARPAVAAFGQQTLGWGLVDLGIAGFAVLRPTRPVDAGRLRRILLVNSLLDVGYVVGGLAVALARPSVGGRLDRSATLGHGTAVVLQGTALLLLDLAHLRRLS